MWPFSFSYFINVSNHLSFSDIRGYWRFYCVFRCWIYWELPIYWGISCTSRSWSTSYLQFGKHVCTWCGKQQFHVLPTLSFCAYSKLPKIDHDIIERLHFFIKNVRMLPLSFFPKRLYYMPRHGILIADMRVGFALHVIVSRGK